MFVFVQKKDPEEVPLNHQLLQAVVRVLQYRMLLTGKHITSKIFTSGLLALKISHCVGFKVIIQIFVVGFIRKVTNALLHFAHISLNDLRSKKRISFEQIDELMASLKISSHK